MPNQHWPVIGHRSRTLLAAALALGFGLAAGPAAAAEKIDPEADKILRSMSTYLGHLPAFRVRADVDNEIVDLAGQKLQLSSSAEVVLQRPNHLYVHRQGPFSDAEVIFDGKTLTLNGKEHGVYAQFESPGSIDQAIAKMRVETGLDAPGADLLEADPYAVLIDDVSQGTYLGTAFVGGVECHHLAFRQAKVDWQLWVQAGDTPLPMKYVITSKWVTGAPEYSVRFADWDTKPQIEPNRFAFVPPAGAKRVDSIPVNEMGEIMTPEVK
jgi:hypothetical protein